MSEIDDGGSYRWTAEQRRDSVRKHWRRPPTLFDIGDALTGRCGIVTTAERLVDDPATADCGSCQRVRQGLINAAAKKKAAKKKADA